MKKIVFIIIVVVLLGASTATYTSIIRRINPRPTSRPQGQTKTESASIEGRVINASGEAIGGAEVFAERDDDLSGLVPSSITDRDGNFKIKIQQAGAYTVYASKERDGYPITISGFHREPPVQIPKVVVAENEAVRDVIVQLGEKAASIEGVILDASTKKSISEATITLRRADNPDILYQVGASSEKKDGKFRVLVPSVSFTIEIKSRGYEPWTYSKDGQSGSDSLRVNRGESRKLDVLLRKKPS